MEDTLRESKRIIFWDEDVVLILVLMEDTLRVRLILLSIIDRSNLPIALAVAVALYVLITTSAKRVNSLTENAKEALGMDY